MAGYISRKYDELIRRLKLEAFRDVIIFMAIILSMHFLWRWWAHIFEYRLFGKDLISPLFSVLVDHLVVVTAWVSNHLVGIETEINGTLLAHDGYDRLGVIHSCSGLKQFYQFLGLMLLFPGPWTKKTWFIPLGLLIIHLTNIFRLVVLYAIVIYRFEWFEFTHDWILRPLFYVIMFLLWVWWVELLAKKPKPSISD